jgi:hypothetical protein
MEEMDEFQEMLIRTGVAKKLIEKGREELLTLLRSGKSPEEIINLYDKNRYKTENNK